MNNNIKENEKRIKDILEEVYLFNYKLSIREKLIGDKAFVSRLQELNLKQFRLRKKMFLKKYGKLLEEDRKIILQNESSEHRIQRNKDIEEIKKQIKSCTKTFKNYKSPFLDRGLASSSTYGYVCAYPNYIRKYNDLLFRMDYGMTLEEAEEDIKRLVNKYGKYIYKSYTYHEKKVFKTSSNKLLSNSYKRLYSHKNSEKSLEREK